MHQHAPQTPDSGHHAIFEPTRCIVTNEPWKFYNSQNSVYPRQRQHNLHAAYVLKPTAIQLHAVAISVHLLKNFHDTHAIIEDIVGTSFLWQGHDQNATLVPLAQFEKVGS